MGCRQSSAAVHSMDYSNSSGYSHKFLASVTTRVLESFEQPDNRSEFSDDGESQKIQSALSFFMQCIADPTRKRKRYGIVSVIELILYSDLTDDNIEEIYQMLKDHCINDTDTEFICQCLKCVEVIKEKGRLRTEWEVELSRIIKLLAQSDNMKLQSYANNCYQAINSTNSYRQSFDFSFNSKGIIPGYQ